MDLVFMDRYIPLSLPGTRKRRKETAGLDIPTTYVCRVTAQYSLGKLLPIDAQGSDAVC